jgi:hypothetical protein
MKRNYSLSHAFAAKMGRSEMLEAPEFDRDCEVESSWRVAGISGDGSTLGGSRFFAPYDEIFRRDLEASNTGGQTIAKYPPSLYKSLQPNSIASRCTWLTGLKENLPIIDATPPATNWPGELGSVNESDQTFTQSVMSPVLVSGQLKISKQLLLTASPGADVYLRQELIRSIFAQLGGVVLNGAGAGSHQPTGIINTVGVNSITLGTTPTWSEIVGCEVTAATQNVTDFSAFTYVVTPTQLGLQKTTARGTALSSFLTDDDGKTNGYDTLTTTILGTSAKLVSGPFDLVLLGLWGSGFEVLIDQVTLAASGRVVVTIFLFCDVLVRHPAAFTVGN